MQPSSQATSTRQLQAGGSSRPEEAARGQRALEKVPALSTGQRKPRLAAVERRVRPGLTLELTYEMDADLSVGNVEGEVRSNDRDTLSQHRVCCCRWQERLRAGLVSGAI